MAILSNIIVLNCRYIEETLAFYQQLFQFVTVNRRDVDEAPQWVHLMHGATAIMLQRDQADRGEPANDMTSRIDLYFFVDNLQDLHHFIKAKGAAVSEIRSTDYQMQEFEVRDPEGNLVIIGEKS